MFSEHRDMEAKAFFRSAQSVTGVTPDRVTTDGHDSYPRAIRTTLGKIVLAGSVEATMSCVTSSVSVPGKTNMSPPPAAEFASFAALRPC